MVMVMVMVMVIFKPLFDIVPFSFVPQVLHSVQHQC